MIGLLLANAFAIKPKSRITETQAKTPVIKESGAKRYTKVIAHFSDGDTSDVTYWVRDQLASLNRARLNPAYSGEASRWESAIWSAAQYGIESATVTKIEFI